MSEWLAVGWYLSVYATFSVGAFALLWGDWYGNFGPNQHQKGGDYANLAWNARQYRSLCANRRACMVFAAIPVIGWFAAIVVAFVGGHRPRLGMPAEAKVAS